MKKFLLFAIILVGCEDKSTNPPAESVHGVSGRIISSRGETISGAKLYCLYDYTDVPADPSPEQALKKLADAQSFSFELFQNTPNPFSNSVYFRFSVPEQCSIQLQLLYGAGGEVMTILNEEVSYGLYQRYFNRLVESMSLKNGTYQCILSGIGKSGQHYIARTQLFVVSDKGIPNAISGNDGRYIFDIKEAFVGDSIMVEQNEWNKYSKHLGSVVRMLVIKEGYQTALVELTLVKDQLLQQDIVLR